MAFEKLITIFCNFHLIARCMINGIWANIVCERASKSDTFNIKTPIKFGYTSRPLPLHIQIASHMITNHFIFECISKLIPNKNLFQLENCSVAYPLQSFKAVIWYSLAVWINDVTQGAISTSVYEYVSIDNGITK